MGRCAWELVWLGVCREWVFVFVRFFFGFYYMISVYGGGIFEREVMGGYLVVREEFLFCVGRFYFLGFLFF